MDLYKLHKAEYATPKTPKLIDTAPGRYLSIEGRGKPGGEEFQERIGALYGMAYTAKFNSKFAGRDYAVCKLEGLWWSRDGRVDFGDLPDDQLCWKMLIRLPDFIMDKDIDEARRALHDKGKEGDFDAVRIETIDEGSCVQMLHVGPYENEPSTIDLMMLFAQEQGLKPSGGHHEIYLSDPRRVPPEKLRTIIRLPVQGE